MHIQFIENIKHRIGQYFFQRDLNKNKRQKSVYNLEDAKSIGMLFEATTQDQINNKEDLYNLTNLIENQLKLSGVDFTFSHV